MVDLRPDTSFYPKSQQLSISDMLSLVRKSQELKTDQTVSGIIGKHTKDGVVDYEGVTNDVGQAARDGSAPLISPGSMTDISTARGQQQTTAAGGLDISGKLLAPALALGNKVTQNDVAPIVQQLAASGVSKTLLAPVLKARDGPELNNALLMLKQATVGAAAPNVGLPGTGGVAGPNVSPATAERLGQGLPVSGQTGIGSTAIPPQQLSDQDKYATFTDRTQPIVNLISTVRKMGPNDFGPGSEAVNNIKKAAAYWGVKIPDLDKASNYDKAQKAMVQIATEAGMGGTDLSTLQAIHGNPNVNMQSATIEELGKTLYAQQAKQAAIAPLAQKLGVPNSQYQNFKGQMNKILDPRAFGYQMMSPKSQKDLVASMSPKELAKFEKSLDVADEFMSKPPEGGWYVPSK